MRLGAHRRSRVPIALAYNSQDTATVGFGPGWRLNMQRRLTINPADGSVTFIGPDGTRATFTNPVGSPTTYTRPTGLYADLVKNGTTYTLTYRDRSKDSFTALGTTEAILTREEDRFGNGVDLAYVAGTSRISTITDTAANPGRTISFAYDASTARRASPTGRTSTTSAWSRRARAEACARAASSTTPPVA